MILNTEIFSMEGKQNHDCEQHPHKMIDQQKREIKRRNTECTHGVHCFKAAKNKCWFKHFQSLNQLPHQGQVHNSYTNAPKPQLYCQFQERYYKGQACKYKHVQEGFLQNSLRQNQQ